MVIVGTGLAGLTTGLLLTEKGYRVLMIEAKPFVGGRTASWDEEGMLVESGFHRVIGYYKHLPSILKKAGINLNKIVAWEDVMDFRSPRKGEVTTFGMAPVHGPIKLLKGTFGNNDTISYKDKWSLFPFYMKGLMNYLKKPDQLDRVSVEEYAKKCQVTDNAYHLVLVPLTSGIFFLPPEKFSAYVFFGLMAPSFPRFYKMRMGAYLGGLSEIMSEPMANVIRNQGGEIITNSKVTHLINENNEVKGVITRAGEYRAKQTVLATEIYAAQNLVKRSNIEHECFNNFLNLKTMSAVSLQIDLDEPSMPYDRTTFGAGTAMASFAEQSRTTFRHVPGRLSVILSPASKFIDMDQGDILKTVIQDAKKLGLNIEEHIIDYRVIKHPNEFYSLETDQDWMRPEQDTPIKGLTLAGDYTKTSNFATMESAVESGELAAKIVCEELEDF